MIVTGLNHFNIRAPYPTLCSLRDFYSDVVGLTVGSRPPFASRGFWLYAGDQAVLHLSELVAGGTSDGTGPGRSTVDHVAFTCRDFDSAKKHLTDCKVEFQVAEVPLTRQRQIFFADPVGGGVELNFA